LEILNIVNEEITDINIQVLNKDEEEFFLNFVGKYVEVFTRGVTYPLIPPRAKGSYTVTH